MSDADGAPDDRFVTVAEAAALLGLSERQVRRYAGRLATDDRREPDTMTGSGRTQAGRLRLSALVAVAGKGTQGAGQEPDAGRTHDRPQPDATQDTDAEDWRSRALVAEARAELLERERGDWHAQAAALADRLKDADARLALVAASSGRLQIAPQEPDSASGGESVDREGKGASAGRVEGERGTRPSLWARLWGKG